MKKIEKQTFASNQNLKERDYWLNKLAGDLVKSAFPYDNNIQYLNNEETVKEVVQFRMPKELAPKLNKICGNQDVKLHVILAASLVALLGKYSGNQDIIVGTPIYKQEIEADFINTVLALRNRVRSNMSFKELILQVHESIFEAIENQNYPIETLLYLLDMPLQGNGFPLFDTAILLKNIHDERYIQDIPLNLVFTFLKTEDSIEGTVQFNSTFYKKDTIKRIITHFKQFSRESLFNINQQLSHIDILTEAERKQLLFDFNKTDAGYPQHKTIHQLFNQQVEKTPASIALGGVRSHLPTEYVLITYKKLHESADCLANKLIKQGVTPDDIIGIMTERSLEMVSAILAVLKSGAAYMPIEPGYPGDRVNFMVKDSSPKLLLITRDIKNKIKFKGNVIYIEEIDRQEDSQKKKEQDLKSNNLAYVIYTSGSTGQPKGVLIEHKNLVRLMVNDQFLFDFNHYDVWTMFHSYCFDFSVWEMYGALLYGGKLVLIPGMIARDPVRYLDILKDEKVTVLNQTPSAFYGLSAEELKFPGKELRLKYIIFGGEALMPQKLKEWKEKYPETRLINMYGITETTVHVTFKDIQDTDIQSNASNIGKPIPTLTVYIMDKNLKLLPIGVSGEICVGGDGVGRGYLNRPELTAERFDHHLPMQPCIHATMQLSPHYPIYLTGDLGKLRANGDIEYLGRIDHQVKIRGFRIELGEIENRLQKYNDIKETAVIAREDKFGSKQLCAYIVSDKEISVSDLREYLAAQCPDYMIPPYFVQLENIPLTSNGKVDRKKLPAPSGNLIDMDDYTPPKNPMEKKLVEIWKNQLELERLGVKDNFFNVGGDSIKAIKIVNSINKQFHTNLRIPDLYLNETIEKLTVIIQQNKSSQHDNRLKEVLNEMEELKNRILARLAEKPGELAGIAGEDIEDLYPMSDIEKGMVYHSSMDPGQGIYHDQMVHQITYVNFDPERFVKAMTLMVEKHPILRTSLHIGDFEKEIQIVHKNMKSSMEIGHEDISHMEMKDQEVYIKEFIQEDRKRPFNVAKLPLWRLKTFALDSDNIVVVWAFHHAIIDGWSDASFKTELNNIYLKLETAPDFVPQKLESSYKNFIVEQIAYKKQTGIREYWRDELLNYKRLQLPGTVQIKEQKKHRLGRFNSYSILLEESLLNRLKNITVKYNTNLKYLCFGAYVYMLNLFSYENDITAGMVTHNRPACKDGEKILGCFLNTIPVRIKIPTSITWGQYIELIDEKLTKLTEYGSISLLEIAKITGQEGKGANPFFDTIFNFIDFFVYQNLQVGRKEDDQKTVKSNNKSKRLSLRGQGNANTLFDFTVDITGGGLGVNIAYWDLLFTAEEVKKYCGYFEHILNRFTDKPESLVGENDFLSLEERKQLLYDFNDTQTEYPQDKTIHRLFEAQVEKTPDHVALVGDHQKNHNMSYMSYMSHMSYKVLNEKSNQSAHLLVQKGVKPDTIVGIMVERSVEMVIAILGILKSGGAYLPIDMEYPPERIKYMLEDSSAAILLTTPDLSGKITFGKEILHLADAINRAPTPHLHLAPPPTPEPVTSLAYIIYTSGSTGRPKGVMVEHPSVVNLALSCKTRYQIDVNERLLQLASICFDASVEQIFPALISGSVLVVMKKEVILDAARFPAFLIRHSITHLDTVPSILNLLPVKNTYPFKRIISGGEACPVSLARKWSDLYNFYNVYGPTETTVTALDQKISGIEASTSRVPVGKPIANVRVYILDLWKKLVPLLVTGELYIGGTGTARGYLNQPQLTAEKFIVEVTGAGDRCKWKYKASNKKLLRGVQGGGFLEKSPPGRRRQKVYKTGDLGRWLPAGNIEFLGRIDHQVKIRGFRIELGEIESRLLSHAEIKEALVLAKKEAESDQQYLASYIVGVKEFDAVELRRYLELELPAYMIPSYFVRVETFPLTPNGKIDVKALPEPGQVPHPGYIAPRNEIEKKLAGIWAEVLGRTERTGIDDDFFQLGGHSLKATIMLSRIHKELNIHVPLPEIFKSSTIRKLAEYIKGTTEERYESIRPVEAKEYYELSSAQKRLYFLQRMELDNTAYNMPQIIPLTSQPDRGKLEKTFIQLIQRHESLRTSFHMVKDIPVQKVHDTVKFDLDFYDVHDYHDFLKSFVRPFDLTKAPLLQVGLIVLPHTSTALRGHPSQEGRGQEYLLMIDMHHIISDGVSHEVLVKDFMVLDEDKESPPPLRIQYKDFSQWQISREEKEKIKQQEAYWLNVFAGEIPVLNIPMDYPRPVIQSFEGSAVHFELGSLETQLLKTNVQEEGVTLYMMLLAIFTILLAKLGGQEDIVIGTPVAGRRHADLEKIIGMFVNTLALRNYPIGVKTFQDFLKELKERTLQAFENQEYQFEDLVEKVAVNRDLGRNPLFDVMLALQNINRIPGDEDEDMTVENEAIDKVLPYSQEYDNIFSTSKFDLTITAWELESRLKISFQYCTKLFKKETVRRFILYFNNIVSKVVKEPGIKISEIEIISEEERKRILYDFNDTQAEYPQDKTIHGLFEEQVERTPHHVALVGSRQENHNMSYMTHMSYKKLNEKSNQSAHLLVQKGVKPDTIVGIMVERSVDMVIGILGILKSNGAYLPIEPDYPKERMNYMLTDSGTKILLSQRHFMDSYTSSLPTSPPHLPPAPATSLAYIIYTSGSTGKPKGVMIEHQNVVQLLFNDRFHTLFDFNHRSASHVWTLFHSFNFDFSVWEMYGALLYGDKLIVVPKMTTRDTQAFLKLLKKEKVTVLNQTPSSFYRLSEEEMLQPGKGLNHLKYVIFGGEALSPGKLKEWKTRYPGIKLINMFGITETTVHVTYKEIRQKEIQSGISNIGFPLPPVCTYVMNNNLDLQAVGVPGELCVGGAGVGRGYLNRQQLTLERFVDNPFKPGNPLYKSGDLAKIIGDGEMTMEMEYLGRIDHQVKIRGYRIELGEIENCLLKRREIKEVVVLTGEDKNGDKYICAYIVAQREAHGPWLKELREFLSKTLPDYMIPSYFVPLKEIPLTPNGKIDRKALPKPEFKGGESYIAPRNEIEKKLAGIWAEVLGRNQRIGINDDFFQLGGHSLKATIMVSRIHKELNVHVPLAQVFMSSTIRGLTEYISGTAEERYESIRPVEAKEYYELSSAQKRLYLLHQMELDNTAYNMPQVIPLTSQPDREKLEKTFIQLIQRHESLRTSFHMVKDIPVQKIHRNVDFKIESYAEGTGGKRQKTGDRGQKTGDRSGTHLSSEFIRPFDLSQAPLLRVGLIVPLHTPAALRSHPRRGTYNSQEEKEDRFLLMVDMHHIISDGVSHEALVKDFMVLNEDKELPPPLRIQYKDFSQWQNSREEKEKIKQQEAYWLNVFAGEIPVLNIPIDYPRPVIQSFEGSTVHFEIGCQETQLLKTNAREKGVTLYMMLLAIFTILLSKLGGQEDIVIGTPVAGRRHADLEKIIGMFVNTLALRNYPIGVKTFQDFLKELKERTLQAFENQEYQFEDLVEKVAVNRDLARSPLFDVMFVLQDINKFPGDGVEDVTVENETSDKALPYSEKYDNMIRTAKFDLSITALELEPGLKISFEYCTKLFKKETIRRFMVYFNNILSGVLKEHRIKISEIEIISQEEKKRILYDFNDTRVEYPQDKSLHRLFEKQVERTPDHVALLGGYQKNHNMSYMTHMSYKELNEKSNQSAHLLVQKGVKPDTIVGIMVEPSVEMVIGILGILKAGSAYLPIEPDYPKERINYMLEDSSAAILLTTPDLSGKITFGKEILYLTDAINRVPTPHLHLPPAPATSLAYVIYTSGTSGKPKGVLVKHRNVIAYLDAFFQEFHINSTDVGIQLASYSFDLFVEEVFPILLRGGKIVIPGVSQRLDIDLLYRLIVNQQVKIIDCTPLLLNEFNKLASPVKTDNPLKSVHTFISGGDVLKKEYVDNLLTMGKVYNTYGPTETTVCASYFNYNEYSSVNVSNVPIGKPISNYSIYILGKNNELQPIGVTGELYVSGPGVTRGYLNQPELTAEKFLFGFYSFYRSYRSYKSYILYKTGDLARWLPGGNIEFLGRIDHQVKIRGFRIELGEIESRLLRHAGIKEALVLAKKEEGSDQQYLACYIVGVKELDVPGLRRYLGLELPAYMIPSYFVRVETFPLTPNGKIDVKALPEPGQVPHPGYISPRNEIEKKLAGIWAEVLGRTERIGIDDDFFQLGGHSLKATIMASRIHKELNIHVPLAEIFKSSTIRKLAEDISGTAEEKYESIRPVEAKEYYELSSAQKRLYLLQQMNVDYTAYNMPQVISLTSQPDREKLEKTFIQLIQRHESLRTSFHMVKDIPVQKVHDTVKFDLDFYDVHDYHDFLKSFVRPFDLAKAPLLRVGLIVLSHTPTALRGHPRRGTYNSQEGKEDRFLLMVDMHHIISDGMSHEVLVKDFMVLNEDKELPPPLRIQYKDFSQWQNSEKEKENIKQQELYWLQEFEGEIPVLNIPTDYNRPVIQSFEGDTVSFEISANEAGVLKTIALKEKMTLYMVLLAIFNVLLAKLSNQEDIVIGTPVAGRRHADLEKIIGMFVNTLAVRNYPKGEKNFNDFLIEVKQRTLEAFENQEYQFEDLVDKVEVKRDASRNPLFDIMFAKQNINVDESKTIEPGGTPGEKQDSKQEPPQDRYTSSKFDMTLTVLESKQKPAFTVTYNTALFKRETIEIFIGYFKRIISSITINIETKLSQIEIMSIEEKRQLVYDFNDTRADSPGDKTIHRLFEEQVEKTADHIGVVDLSHHLSYRELNNKSHRLARLVKRKAVGPGNIAGIITHPTQEMLVGIMGILKAGACYLPIDPANPPARISYMLMDSETKLVLIQENLADDIKDYAGEILKIRDGSLYKGESPADVQNHNAADPVYMIYTSGTTGTPKGVMVKHENLVNYVTWFSDTAGLTCKDKTVLTSSFAFDLGYTSLYPSILKGGQIHLLPKETYMIPEALLDYIQLHGITYLKMTPSLFSPIVEDPYFSAKICRCLRLLVLGGEPIDVSDVEKALCICTHLQVMNHYGPTEVTIGCIAQLINIHNWEAFRARPTIGKPIRNINVFILDKYLNLLPIRIAGELYLGGAGVAKGYFKRKSLTAEKFIPLETAAWSAALPPTPGPGNGIIYRTGDQARWLPDGYIEFLGRVDQQVKIRGYRIELGEIESLLQRHEEIRECVVEPGVDEKENRYLCAYIVPARKFEMQELREYLLQELPEYMVPSYFTQLDKIPLTLNGKVDRKALPPMGIVPGTAYTAPADRVEERLVELWSEVLFAGEATPTSAPRPQLIGTHDNFFELGGHSLKAIILLSKIQKAFNVKIPLAVMFRSPTIKGLSASIKETDKDRFTPIMPVEKKEYYILSSAQKRLYILQQMEPGSTAYNIPTIIPLTADIDIKRLQGIFLQMIKRHESLRTSFHMMENEPVLKVYEPGEIEFSIEYISMSEGPESSRTAPGTSPQTGNRDTLVMETKKQVIKYYQRAFDLTQAPLLKVAILETKEGEYTMLMLIHHIISDMLTRNILRKEFSALYQGREIPPLRIQYNDFSGWQYAEKKKEYHKRQERYWLRQYEDKIPELDLPTDYPRPEVQLFAGNILYDRIPCDTGVLRTMALENRATLFMLFLAIFNIFLSKVSGQEDIVVGTPVAGRRHADLEGIVGLFVNTLALRNKPKGEKTFTTFLQEVKETTLEAFDNQDYQFEDLVEKLAVKRDRHNPIFDVMFTCHDQQTDPAENTDLKHRKSRNQTKINIPNTPKKQTLDENNLETSKFDLYLNVVVGKTLGFSFEYSTELFRAETIQTFAKAFKEIVLSAIANKNIKLENITLTTTLLKADLKQVQDELAELEF